MIIGYPTVGADGEGANRGRSAGRTARLTEKVLGDAPMPPFLGIGESGEVSLEVGGQWAVYDMSEEGCVGRGRVFGELDTMEVTREFYEGCGLGGECSESGGDGEDSLAVEALL
jgi:hypothetical protein